MEILHNIGESAMNTLIKSLEPEAEKEINQQIKLILDRGFQSLDDLFAALESQLRSAKLDQTNAKELFILAAISLAGAAYIKLRANSRNFL